MLKILFEDEYIMVVDKAAGLVVDKSQTQQGLTLEDILAERFRDSSGGEGNLPLRSGIVHRLDKDTSGVLLVAKNQAALENLQAQFKERKTKKEYLALVHGLVEEKGRIEGNIGRNPGNREKFIVMQDEEGKEAVTEYEPIQRSAFSVQRLVEIFPDYSKIQLKKLDARRYQNYTLLSCHPLTGRTHQIRVHLKYINHPIVCDEKYVGRKMYRLDKRWCPRMFLHAKRLGFYHPKSGEWMEVEAELPEDLQTVLDKLTKA